MSLSRFLLKIIPSSFLKEDDATQKKVMNLLLKPHSVLT